MANPEHLRFLSKGAIAWLYWRNQNPQIVPDLSGANLQNLNLQRYNLSGVNLQSANLNRTRLSHADLSYGGFTRSLGAIGGAE
ncbi:MAG: pentapeptide repeat-containing protein [Acaryochloridaceae cyanobacterium RL_2_7]|nr:pentapeptide repeat-containing protein [Acaryochloridaceae cyanobacterium RL_2_7]